MIQGNKGEWSEVYVLFKVLGEKRIYAGDDKLQKLADVFYPVLNIIRYAQDNKIDFSYHDDLVFIKSNGDFITSIPVNTLAEQATNTLNEIKAGTGASFACPDTEALLNQFAIDTIKAKSKSKSDINIVIHDIHTQTDHLLGFSIKSHIGGKSTLFNAGNRTIFTFELQGGHLTEDKILEINNINGTAKVKNRVNRIISEGGTLSFIKIADQNFNNNLTLIDSLLPKILAEMLLSFYTESKSKISDLIEDLTRKNSLEFDLSQNHPFYEFKIKRLLCDIALGMTPSVLWDGKNDATGGYIIVKEDGDVLCYHLFNRNVLENYLLASTKFETPSTTKFKFAKIYQKENKLYIDLCLQIRFV